jgi:hypothetical protein
MPRMPRYAKLQNALARRSEGAKTNRIWAFLNSALGLWFLSAIFLTVGGAAVSSRNQCISTFETDADTFRQLSIEISGRRQRIINTARTSSNDIDFRKGISDNRFSAFKQFDGQPLSALLFQQSHLRRKLKVSPPDDEIPKGKYGSIVYLLEGVPSEVISDIDIHRPRDDFDALSFSYQKKEVNDFLATPTLDCSIQSLAKSLFFSEDKHDGR